VWNHLLSSPARSIVAFPLTLFFLIMPSNKCNLNFTVVPATRNQLDALALVRNQPTGAVIRALIDTARLTRAGIAALPPKNHIRGPGAQVPDHLRAFGLSVGSVTTAQLARLDKAAAAAFRMIGEGAPNRSRTMAAFIATAYIDECIEQPSGT
jgi:hypothetical protein